MSKPSGSQPRYTARAVQLSRAAIAAIAALMITFSPDHSAGVGLSVFSGFAMLTGLILVFSAIWVYPAGRRWAPVLLCIISLAAGMVASIDPIRTPTVFFVTVISWALLTGVVELVWGLRERRRVEVPRAEARDQMTVGVLGLLLAGATLVVPVDYLWDYTIQEAGDFQLTGITIAVGLYGGYAAIAAVYLAIAGLTPRQTEPGTEGSPADEAAASTAAARGEDMAADPASGESRS